MPHHLPMLLRTRRTIALFSSASLAVSVGVFSACGSGQDQGSSTQDAAAEGASVDSGLPDASEGGPACTQTFGPGSGNAATIAVDPSKTMATFVPQTLFGINAAYFIPAGDLLQTQPQVQAAGDTLIRYPGGSSSDDYHWNGAGQYDSSNRWIPSSTTYAPGFPGRELYRGTTSVDYGMPANVTDGDLTTAWLSNTDTASPAAQWVYVDLGSAQTVSSVTIAWGTPYATSFEVQTSSSTAAYPPPYQGGSAQWQTTSAGTVTGAGGTQQVMFGATSGVRYVRILMSASSAGAGGAYSIAELSAFDGATQLTTNAPTTSQSPTTASSTDPANVPAAQTNFDFESFMTYVSLFQPAAVPVLTVNVGTGTPAEAAAWVHYANVVKGYGIRYWQIGNEMEGNWETGGPLDAQDYVRRYAEYFAAMKGEDPTITVLGPVSGGINEPSNLGDDRTFVQAFVELLHQQGLDAEIGGIDFHWYPNYGPVTWSAALQTTSQIGAFASSLKGWLAQTDAGTGVPVFMSEYNLGLGPNNVPPVAGDQLLGGVWLATSLGEFIKNFGPGGGTALWNLTSGYTTPDSTDPTAGDLGYLQGTQNPYRFQPHADYWATQMLAGDWAIAGDSRPHTLVSSTSSAPLLATYADLRPDGSLSLLVVNQDQTNDYSASMTLGSFTPATAADVWTFGATNYTWETSNAPYHAAPDLPPTYSLACGASSSPSFTFPAASITVIRFASATSDASAGTTTTQPGDASVATVLIDDMSNPNAAEIQLPPLEDGGVSGYWYTYIGGGSGANDTGSITPSSSGSFTYTALQVDAGPDGGVAPPVDAGAIANASCMSGVTPAAQYAYAAEGFDFEDPSSGSSAVFVDVSRFAGIQFWTYGGLALPSTVQVQIPDKESDPRGGICGMADGSTAQACYQHPFIDLLVPPGWSFHRLPFAFFEATPGYGYPQPVGGDMTTAQAVHFQVNQPDPAGAGGGPVPFDFCVAEIAFYE